MSRKNADPSSLPMRDEDPQKRFPNSISALFRTVHKYWLYMNGKSDDPRQMGVEKFLEQSNFAAKYLEVAQRFPGISAAGLEQDETKTHYISYELPRVKKLYDKLTSGKGADLKYAHVKAMAEFLDIPDSLILIIGMVTSIDRRLDDVEEKEKAMLQFIHAMQHALSEAEQIISDYRDQPEVFSKKTTERVDKHDRETWIVNEVILKRMVDSFGECELDAYRRANGLK